ncbi:MAG: SprB repeat-containing protein, partial [Bacteroidetes bacterium]|nr:SprB repeat-containing protein [Bacteroidota bacterium]
MKINYLNSLLMVLLLSPILKAQVATTETFESYTTGKPTSFTSNSQAFTIVTNSCGASNGGTFGIFIPGQAYNLCSQSATSTGTGYGVAIGCASSSACGGTSDKFIDNGNSNGTSQIYSIKTSNAALFNIKSLYIYVSADHAASSAVSGVTFRGKKAGSVLFTLAPASLSINTNGFTFIDFVAASYGSINIDELEIQGGASINYVAVDNFRWSTISTLAATATSTAVSCNGGSNGRASVSVTGGTTPYVYSWSPSGGTASLATGLSAGTYTCTITDGASTQITATVTVSQPSAISVTPSFTAPSCNGGSNGRASVSVTGGTSPYFYSWAPSGGTGSTATGLSVGSYTCTITDNNSCTKPQTFNITQPSALVTSTAVTNVACNGGSNGVAAISASGGAGGYTYLWSNGGSTSTITGLLASVYSATVTDANNCKSIKAATVTQPPALVTATAVTNVACNGGSNGVAAISASGGAGGYTYLWSNGGSTSTITGLLAGVYTATVTDANSCTSIKSAQITQPTALATSTSVTNVSCNGGSNGVASVTASGGAGGYTYSWAPSGGTAATATGLSQGNYTV